MLSSTEPRVRIGFDATWLTKTNKSGTGYYTQNLIRSLAELYPNEVEITGYCPAEPKITQEFTWPSNVHFKVNRIMPLKLINLLRRFRIEIPFELLTGKRFDFLIFPSFLSFPSLFHTPSTVVVYDLAYLDKAETVSDRNRKDLVSCVPLAIKRAKFITTISKYTKRRIESVYSPSKPIIITHIPPLPLSKSSKNPEIIKEFGIDRPYILFVGTIEPRKNILGLLKAYSGLSPELLDKYSLVLAGGGGWNDHEIKQELESLKSKGLSIILTGYVSDIQKNALYKSAALFVLVSFYEGFGMPLLEAMVNNIPVLASDIPVFHEVCGSAAAYADPEDSTAITSAISKLLLDPGSRQKLIALGQDNLKRFSWVQVAKDLYSHIKATL